MHLVLIWLAAVFGFLCGCFWVGRKRGFDCAHCGAYLVCHNPTCSYRWREAA